jgi:hypothetical protein
LLNGVGYDLTQLGCLSITQGFCLCHAPGVSYFLSSGELAANVGAKCHLKTSTPATKTARWHAI